MNKEQAEIYVTKSLDLAKTTSKRHQYELLLVNFVFLGIAIVLYHELTFVIIISFVACLEAFFTIVFAKKRPHYFKVTILIAIQIIVLSIALNGIIWGMYQLANSFVLWEYLLSIAIQVMAWVISIFFEKKRAERFKPQKYISKAGVVASATAGLTYALTLFLCRIFSPSLSTLLSIAMPLIALLLNMLVCLMGTGVTAAIYRACLIKKFQLFDNK